MKIIKPFSEGNTSERGFTIIELTAVLVILSALSAISLPNINKWIKLSRIDEAKGSLNFAAANCLQNLRTGSLMSETKVADPDSEEAGASILSNEKLNSIGYKIKTEKNKCSEFLIEPINDSETILFTMGFRVVDEGDVTKIAFPQVEIDPSAYRSCQRWAGKNCGVPAETLARWAKEAAEAAAKKECNDEFYKWLNETPPDGGSGRFQRWDDDAKSFL